MAKSETITTRAPGAGKKTPSKKAPHAAKPKSKGTARKATSSKAGAARKATTSKKKPRGKTEAEAAKAIQKMTVTGRLVQELWS